MIPSQDRFPPLPARAALLLDFDGTLVDIAPAPDLVVVPDALRDHLGTLRARLDGALAVITGRTVADIDRFLPALPEAVAAEHGAVVRRRPGAALETAGAATPPDRWRTEAALFADAHAGVRLEGKSAGFVLHYRGAPDAGPAVLAFLSGLARDDADRFHVLESKMAWELRARGTDKGTAVRDVMAAPPFRDRVPVFVGDDTTDRDGIAAARAMGGAGYLVAETFGEPSDVRAWLAWLAREETGSWAG